jgi:hypothetical protein
MEHNLTYRDGKLFAGNQEVSLAPSIHKNAEEIMRKRIEYAIYESAKNDNLRLS